MKLLFQHKKNNHSNKSCIYWRTRIKIPSSVTYIGNYCFWGCYNLTTINIPTSVTSIGDWCFNGCSNLTTINISSNVTSIGDGCFYRCSNLASGKRNCNKILNKKENIKK